VTTTLLEAAGISAGYGTVNAVREVDLLVRAGEVVALLGANGAGKTTTLLALAGQLPVVQGEVRWNGVATRAPLHRRASAGLAFVPEDRGIFMSLTVRENLMLGKGAVTTALSFFPELEPHLARRAGLLSGGQQQMLALGRALAAAPRALLVDELSLGLAPIVIERLLAAVRSGADSGIGVLLVEQHVQRALRVADRVYVLERGRVVLSGTTQAVADQMTAIEASYLAAREPASESGDSNSS
jgi:branched-chain amino acid transport system ATP-binding protein